MSISNNEKNLSRRKTGDSLTSFPDADMDVVFADIEDEYSAYSHRVHLQILVVRRIDELWTASLSSVTYKQNETSENLSDIPKNLKAKLDKEQAKLDLLIADEKSPAAVIAALRKVPATKREYPRS